MKRQIFVNLPVKNIAASQGFFRELGFSFGAEFTTERSVCIVIEEGSSYVMLLVEEDFRGFAPNPISDATKATEVLLCVSCTSRADVDTLVGKAVAAGGRTFHEPVDYGFMYTQSIIDLDGHVWEFAHISGKPPAAA